MKRYVSRLYATGVALLAHCCCDVFATLRTISEANLKLVVLYFSLYFVDNDKITVIFKGCGSVV